MSDTASPVMRSRSQSFGKSTRAVALNTSGSCRCTHMSFGAVKPGMAGWGLVKQGYAASREEAVIKLP